MSLWVKVSSLNNLEDFVCNRLGSLDWVESTNTNWNREITNSKWNNEIESYACISYKMEPKTRILGMD